MELEQLITLTIDGSEPGVSELSALRVEGRQRLGRPYEYRVRVSSREPGGLPDVAIDEILSAPATLAIQSEGDQLDKVVHGVIADIELHPMYDAEEAIYELTLVPELWRLGLAIDCRCFENQTVEQILTLVLEQHGITYEWHLAESFYPTLEYVVQYQESDLDFFHRQLEHWGLFYFFEQTDDGAVLHIGDANDAFPSFATDAVPYAQTASEEGNDYHVLALGRRTRPRTREVELRDYNHRLPRHVSATVDVDLATGFGRHLSYGEHFADEDAGQPLAKVRAQQLMVSRETYTGRTSVRAFAPGHRFSLTGYPSPDLDREYVVVEVRERSGFEGHAYECELVLIDASVPFRVPCETAKPRIDGYMHATVTGSTTGMVAPIDADGSYTLEMPYASAYHREENIERKVRMAQPLSGEAYGVHFPLYHGIEVVVAHLDGDPDRPIIVGAMPNKRDTSPVTEPDATKSRIKTKSGILMEFEDAG